MMEGGRDEVNMMATSGMNFLIQTSRWAGGRGWIFRK
jgi:hypothetical protein